MLLNTTGGTLKIDTPTTIPTITLTASQRPSSAGRCFVGSLSRSIAHPQTDPRILAKGLHCDSDDSAWPARRRGVYNYGLPPTAQPAKAPSHDFKRPLKTVLSQS